MKYRQIKGILMHKNNMLEPDDLIRQNSSRSNRPNAELQHETG